MKKFILPMLAIGAAMSLVGCSDDLDVKGSASGSEYDGKYAYINATISLANTGSRSYTDWDDEGNEPGDSNSNGSSDSSNPNTNPNNPTSGNDTEEGHDYENEVRSMVLVIATTDNEYITHLVINGMTAGFNQTYTSISKIPFDVLEVLYGVKDGENGEKGAFKEIAEANKDKSDAEKVLPTVRLFVYCNYTQEVMRQFNTLKSNSLTKEWIDFTEKVEEASSMAGETPQSTSSIWSRRSFLMTNAELYETSFPADIDAWTQFSDDKHSLNLTDREAFTDEAEDIDPIDVERAVARIDFKDASEAGDQVYRIITNIGDILDDGVIVDAETQVDDTELTNKLNLFNVKLERMVLVNMAKEFYYLRHMCASDAEGNPVYDGSEGTKDKVTIFGKQTASKWVVDPHWDMEKKPVEPSNASNIFNFPLFDKDGQLNTPSHYNNIGGKMGWYISNITDVLKGTSDKWSGEQFAEGQSGYHIWRYITENTLPGIAEQQVQQSTGIIFKASIMAGDDIEKSFMEKSDTEGDATEQKTYFVSQEVRDAFANIEAKTYPEAYQYPGLYMYQNMLYAYPKDIIRAAKADGQGGALYYAVDNIIKNWYLIEYFDAAGKDITPTVSYEEQLGDNKKTNDQIVFFYSETEPSVPDDLSKVEGAKKAQVVRLTIETADMILNGTARSENVKDYGIASAEDVNVGRELGKAREEGATAKYNIDFKDRTDSCPDELKLFQNSRFMELSPAQNITVFVPTNDDNEGLGYYCYYFYWLRHNDNGLGGKMGTMEFAAVRNNVYKLAVTKINGIGHPRNIDRDPDPIKPGDPDEDTTRSIEIQVHVLPWTVRVNNIEF